jgi:hypothetical protein
MFLAGCSPIDSSPEDVLTQYLNSYYKGSYSEAYTLLSAEDRKYKTQVIFEEGLKKNPVENLILDKTSFNIKEVIVNGSNAKATVEISSPDLTRMGAELMAIFFSSALKDKLDFKEMEGVIAKKLQDKSLPISTSIQKINLLKEEDGWKVSFNFEGIEKSQEVAEQAELLEKKKKYEEAKVKYQEATSLDENNKLALSKLETIDNKIVAFNTKKAYFDKIEVRNVSQGTTTSNEDGVFGEIKNNGDKTLSKVEITVYCLDKSDKVVFEKSYYPVLVTKYSFGGDNAPLKPNYSKKFGYKLDDAPSDWNKKITVSITDIEFE